MSGPAFIVDERLASRVSTRRWSRNPNGYLATKVAGKTEYLHRFVWAAVNGVVPGELDHINGDKADNRLQNLRPATRRLQSTNKPASGFRRKRGRCYARIKRHGVQCSLGGFKTEAEATAAYSNAKEIIIEFEALLASDSTCSVS